jgi:DNA (cytosine-5)-methyltransferase 1
MTLTVGSLFSGIGGMDLGLERAGHTVIWQSEIDPYCNKVLKKHWPTVPNLGDITTIDWGKVEPVDIICGGYPCQPFSTAGKRNGKNDPRHLWPAMHNAICRLRPRYALMENVRGHLSMGFGDVLADLAKIGYDAEWQVIPAAAVGAPHRRDRVFIVAYPNSVRLERQRAEQSTTRFARGYENKDENVANTKSKFSNVGNDYPGNGTQPQTVTKLRDNSGAQDVAYANSAPKQHQQVWQVPEPNFERRSWWEIEPDVGRMAHGVPNRVDRFRGLGNAVVPQVAELVGRLIGEHAKQLK